AEGTCDRLEALTRGGLVGPHDVVEDQVPLEGGIRVAGEADRPALVPLQDGRGQRRPVARRFRLFRGGGPSPGAHGIVSTGQRVMSRAPSGADMPVVVPEADGRVVPRVLVTQDAEGGRAQQEMAGVARGPARSAPRP